MERKDTNPKDALGVRKLPFSTLSAVVSAEVGVAMLEGALKYGRHNYRVAGIRASVYYDATLRHMTDWWEGEDIDPESGLSHVTKAIASLYVLRDAMLNDMVTDDRPPPAKAGWLKALNARVVALLEKYPSPVPPFTRDDTQPAHCEACPMPDWQDCPACAVDGARSPGRGEAP